MRNACVVALCALALGACTKGVEPSVPSYPVALELNLNAHAYGILRSPAGMLRITEPQRIVDRLGYGGILVVRGTSLGEYYAFDLACPVEIPQVVRLELKDLTPECPSCGSRFDVLQGSGVPISGRAINPLRKYRVGYNASTNRLVITNH